MPEDWARPVVTFEIRGRDRNKLQEFYGELFNWDIIDDPMGIGRVAAGVGPPEPGPPGVFLQGEPGVALFIQVLDLHATMEKAKTLGGKVLGEPFQVPNGPTIARIADPEGTAIGLVQQ